MTPAGAWLSGVTVALMATSVALLLRASTRLMDRDHGMVAADRLVDRQPLFICALVLVLCGMAWMVRAGIAAAVEGLPTQGATYQRLAFTGHALCSAGLMAMTLVLEADLGALASHWGRGGGQRAGGAEK